MVSPTIQKLARRLLILEGARAPASETGADVAVRVVEQFRERLIKLAGVHGFCSLLSRALTVAKIENQSLHSVSVSPDGHLVGFDVVEQDEAAVVAHLLDLLIKFIGESLTLQLVSDVWPQASLDEVSAEEQAQNEANL